MTLLDPSTQDGTAAVLAVSASLSDASLPSGARRVPFEMPAGERYYWMFDWQQAEGEALLEIDEGNYIDFSGDEPEDIVRWLNQPED